MRRAVETGLPSSAVGWRHLRAETPGETVARLGRPENLRVLQPATRVGNPLPRNVPVPEGLSADPGWWGFAQRDVPEREIGATTLATLPDCTVVCYGTEAGEKFHPAIVTADGRSVELPQIVFRPPHAVRLRRARGQAPQRRARAVWILERVYDNHSHWLTAHLPKIVLLRELGLLEDTLLPPRRTPAMDASLRMLGLKPDAFASFDPERPLEVERLTVVGTDRFRPELLQAVRAAMPQPQPQAPATRKVFVSRAKARGRHLVGEQALWPALQRRGFERVCMEDLAFEAQVRLMQQTRVLLAPHGAGLTNMLFCPSAAEVLEIADPGYPNPNFYAMAAALGHGYWLIEGRGVGEGHALQRDLEVAPEAVRAALDRLEAEGVA